MTEIYISDRDTLEEKRARVSQTRRGTAWDGVGRAVRPRRLRLASSTGSGRTRRSGCSDTRLIIRVAVLCLSTPPAVLSAFNLWSKGGHGMRKDLARAVHTKARQPLVILHKCLFYEVCACVHVCVRMCAVSYTHLTLPTMPDV